MSEIGTQPRPIDVTAKNEIKWNECPVCKASRSGEMYEVCIECGWESDPHAEYEPLSFGGPNHISLMEARRNFLAYGTSDAHWYTIRTGRQLADMLTFEERWLLNLAWAFAVRRYPGQPNLLRIALVKHLRERMALPLNAAMALCDSMLGDIIYEEFEKELEASW